MSACVYQCFCEISSVVETTLMFNLSLDVCVALSCRLFVNLFASTDFVADDRSHLFPLARSDLRGLENI